MTIETRIAVALVNATWQGALVSAAAAAALRFAGRTSASVRCAVWCAVLAVVAVLPAVDLLAARVVSVPQAAAPARYAVRTTRSAVAAAGADVRPVPASATRRAPLITANAFDALGRS